MTDRKPMSKAFQNRLASRVRYALDHVMCSGYSSTRGHIQDALDECESGERKHRAMGARWTNGSASYRISVSNSAALMMGRSFFCEAAERASGSVEDIAGYRSDHLHMVLAYAELTGSRSRLAAGLGQEILSKALARLEWPDVSFRKQLDREGFKTALEALAAWSYSDDCAERV